MPIAEYTPAREEIFYPGGSFAVRGLGVADIESLVRLHLTDMETIHAIVTQRVSPDGVTSADLTSIAVELIQRLPVLAATAIALAADELEHTPKVLQMPLHVQFVALKAIAELTFKDIAGLKLMIATTVTAVRAAQPRTESSLLPGLSSSGGTGGIARPPTS